MRWKGLRGYWYFIWESWISHIFVPIHWAGDEMFWHAGGTQGKSPRVNKVCMSHPLGIMNVCTKSLNGCWDISVLNKAVGHLTDQKCTSQDMLPVWLSIYLQEQRSKWISAFTGYLLLQSWLEAMRPGANPGFIISHIRYKSRWRDTET